MPSASDRAASSIPCAAAAREAVRARRLAWLVAGVAFAVSLTNLRPMGAGDTIPTRLLPFSLLREGNLDLDEFGWVQRSGRKRPYFVVRDTAGHWRSKYPVATSVVAAPLALPFVWWAGARGLEDRDARFRLLTAVFERLAAASIGALSVGLVLLAACEIAPLRWAVAAAVVYAFGTGVWVYSQALWQHGLAAAATAGAALCVLRPESRRRALLAGAGAALALAARPNALIVAALIGLAMWCERRAWIRHFLGAFAFGVFLLVAYNVSTLAQPTGGYGGGGLGLPGVEALLGVLVSPNRGLLVYTPLALLALAALSRSTRPRTLRLLALALPAYALQLAGLRVWWGGFSYGPRYFTDVMPLIVLCALPTAQRLWAHRAGRALLIAGAAWGIGVQVVGVYCDDNDWNNFPMNVDKRSERLWSWSDPQIVRALRSGWRGGEFAPLLWQLATDSRPAPLALLEPADLAGTIAPTTARPWTCRAGDRCAIEVQIANRSPSTVWPAYSDFGNLEVGVGAVWRDGETVVPGVGGFVPLRRQLGPGDLERVRLSIDAPAAAGAYQLDLVVVQSLGHVGRRGDAELTAPVLVE